MNIFETGTLWKILLERTGRAINKGALKSIPTDYEFVEDRGIRFFVRVLSSLERKDAEKRLRQAQEKKTGRQVNPFLPYEEDLYVADVSDTHVAVLNKFNVVEHHLLIITRDFEEQESLLTLEDFRAAWRCMDEYEGLMFYNGGVEAGASQRHKHLQMVPLPLAPVGPRLPVEPLFPATKPGHIVSDITAFPFRSAFVGLNNGVTAEDARELYAAMLDKGGIKGMEAGGWKRQSGPYCLLATREWMFLIPRSKEFFEGISVNSIGFAGGLLVRNSGQMTRLKEAGPMEVLKSVAFQRPTS